MQEKISISINTALLAKADSLIDHKSVKKRSQAFEKILSDYFSSRWHGPAVMLLGKNEKINKSSLIQNIRGLCNLSLKEIIILAGPHKAAVSEYLSQSNLPVPVRYLDEGSLRGTAGALLLAKPYISSDFIVLSDTLFKFDFSRILDFHLKTGSLATIGVTTISMEQSTDSISLDGNRIISFRYNDGKRTYITNAGIYIFTPEIFSYLPKKGSLEKDAFPTLSAQGKLLAYMLDSKLVAIEGSGDLSI